MINMRQKTLWVVQGFLEIPDVHHDLLATHAPVASDSSLMLVPSLTVRYKMKLKQMDINTTFLNSLLDHEIWVRFPAGYDHP